MPTGYTAIIEEKSGVTFEEFLLRCARAFGATIMQRDDALTDPPKIPEFDSYHAKELEQARATLETWLNVSPQEAARLADAEFLAQQKEHEERQLEVDEINARYAFIREAALRWMPPTKDHEGLQQFMLEQIDMCYPEKNYAPKPVRVSGEAWLQREIAKAQEDIAYHEAKLAEDQKRHAGKAAWVEALYRSIGREARR